MFINGPLDGIHFHIVRRFDHRIVVISIRRSKKQRADAGHGLDLFIAGGDLRCHLRLGKLRHVRVGIGVVAHFVAGGAERADGIRIFVHPCADDEKRRLHIVTLQNVDQRLRLLVAPRGVERDGYLFLVRLHVVNRKLSLAGGSLYRAGAVETAANSQHGCQHKEQHRQNSFFCHCAAHHDPLPLSFRTKLYAEHAPGMAEKGGHS